MVEWMASVLHSNKEVSNLCPRLSRTMSDDSVSDTIIVHNWEKKKNLTLDNQWQSAGNSSTRPMGGCSCPASVT